jgi:hypothetical protein
MKRKKITIVLNELPKGAKYVSAEVVSQFQIRLSEAMKTVNNDFEKRQKVTAEKRGYISLG